MESKPQHLLLGIWEVSVLGGKWVCVMASLGLLRLPMILHRRQLSLEAGMALGQVMDAVDTL